MTGQASAGSPFADDDDIDTDAEEEALAGAPSEPEAPVEEKK
jgi:hypothetical protein